MAEITDQEYVESIVKPLVENPDAVVTSRTVDEMGVLIQLTLDRSDMGKVIGRDGRTAKAIRSLLRVFGSKSNARINLKIVEPEGGDAEGDVSEPRKPSRSKAPETETETVEIPEHKEDEKATSVI